MNMIKTSVRFNEKTIKRMKQISKEKGFSTTSDFIRGCVAYCLQNAQVFDPDYTGESTVSVNLSDVTQMLNAIMVIVSQIKQKTDMNIGLSVLDVEEKDTVRDAIGFNRDVPPFDIYDIQTDDISKAAMAIFKPSKDKEIAEDFL
jgi:hypothetical protein